MPSEYPEQDARTAPFQSETKEKVLVRREPEADRRYLDMPSDAERGAQRNLTLGIAFLVLAAIGFWMGWYYAGGAAVRTLFACLLTFGATWLLLHFNVLRQRFGGLFGLGSVALLGAVLPFVEGGFRKIDDLARERLGGQSPNNVAVETVPPPPVTVATAPPAPPTIPLPEENEAPIAPTPAITKASEPKEVKPKAAKEKVKAPLTTKPSTEDASVRELIVPEPPADAQKLIRVKEDVKVDLDGRPTIIRGGTLAPFKAFKDGEVTFIAGDHEISISSEFVMFTGVSKETPAEITKLAEQEAMTRYPKLREADSRENILFVTRVKEAQLDPEMKDVVFKDPKWPLVLAEALAQQEHWVRADLPPSESETSDPAGAEKGVPPSDVKPNEIPANELPATPSNERLLPPNVPAIPQQAEPPPTPAPAPAPAPVK